MDKRKLINNLIKPWEELSDLLSRPLAMQPDESDFVTKAESLSVFISHFPEQCGLTRNQIDSRSKPNALITDIADSSKHKELSKQDRNSDMKVTADYEFRVNAEGHNEYRFIRNCIRFGIRSHIAHLGPLSEPCVITIWYPRFRPVQLKLARLYHVNRV
jgi:hypothetical protein